MKATELKVGDLVLFKGKFLITIEEAGYDLCSGYNEDGIFFNRIPCEYVHPIPLTEEILEKNGWKKQCSNLDMPGWSNNHVKLYPQDKKFGGGFSFFYSGNSVQYIHYVHQLQHILWALGLDDNLKI